MVKSFMQLDNCGVSNGNVIAIGSPLSTRCSAGFHPEREQLLVHATGKHHDFNPTRRKRNAPTSGGTVWESSH